MAMEPQRDLELLHSGKEHRALLRDEARRARSRHDDTPLTMLDTWHFLGALMKLQVPKPTGGMTPLFDVVELRAHRDNVFAAMDSNDQFEAMLVMPDASETLSALRARLAHRENGR